MLYSSSSQYLQSGQYNTGLPATALDLAELEPLSKDIYMERGDTFVKEFTFYDDIGQALNLTGYTVSGNLYKYKNTEPIADLGCEVLTPVINGKIKISLGSLVTRDFIQSRYIYSVKIADGASIITLAHGQILIS